jgi:hypothetical protein
LRHRYGLPWCSSSAADLVTTATSGVAGAWVASQTTGAASAPARLAASAASRPRRVGQAAAEAAAAA